MTARVLIIDDTVANLVLLERQLNDEFFDTLTATSGAQGLEIARRELPDLVLLDVMMPGMDGFETCRRLKTSPETAHIPVVMITALDQPSARMRGLGAGADDFLVKPVRDVELLARVRSLVRLKTLFDELRAREATDGLLGLGSVLDLGPGDETATLVMVDDGSSVIGEVLGLLQGFGTVATLPNERALDRLRKMPCDLVVIALMDGHVEGLRLVSRLRSYGETRRLPVLALVDHDDPLPLVKGFDLGVDDCVKYPADPLELSARVRTLLKRKRLADRMRQNVHLSMRLATTDAVTGLYNRHYMTHHLATSVSRARTSGRPLSLLLLDIDHFKAINDTHGHAAGDRALRAVAERIVTNVRGVDLCARYGGEEFVVIMPDTELTTASTIAERIRLLVAAESFGTGVDGAPLSLTISIGAAVLHEGDIDGVSLLSRADAALYAAKRAGRNRVMLEDAREAA